MEELGYLASVQYEDPHWPRVFQKCPLSLPKMLSGANAFEISDIERMNIRAHQPGVWHVTMLHALGLPEITFRQGQVAGIAVVLTLAFCAVRLLAFSE